jgi:hypothetical protein
VQYVVEQHDATITAMNAAIVEVQGSIESGKLSTMLTALNQSHLETLKKQLILEERRGTNLRQKVQQADNSASGGNTASSSSSSSSSMVVEEGANSSKRQSEESVDTSNRPMKKVIMLDYCAICLVIYLDLPVHAFGHFKYSTLCGIYRRELHCLRIPHR